MPAFSEFNLKAVALRELKQAANTLELPTYGNKKDIAGRIAMCRGGKGILRQLINTSAKKMKANHATKGCAKRVRLAPKVYKKKIDVEATTSKKSVVEAPATNGAPTFVNATKQLSDDVCKSRNLTLMEVDYLKPTPIFRYKIDHANTIMGCGMGLFKKKADETAQKKKADESDDESDDDVEKRVAGRLMGKKVKREHVNGMLEPFGVDASSWSMADAKEELVVQMLNESDEESDEEEDN